MQELDKIAMGARIRQIRTRAGLRQWELAKSLGTTQSAVHKYEHGVVPEPRRLIELARVGSTSIEWILTGRHWENGSADQRRLTADVLETARVLREVLDDRGARVDEALRVIRSAVHALGEDPDGAEIDPAALAESLRAHSRATLRLLESAWRIQRAVVARVLSEADGRLTNGGDEDGDADMRSTTDAGSRKGDPLTPRTLRESAGRKRRSRPR